MDIYSILDKNTSDLLAELRLVSEIDFREKNINYCEAFTQNGKSIIYYNPKIVDTESIAHELLHIWLNKFNYILGYYICEISESNWKLRRIFNKFLCDYIENCCDHYKMYPKYKAMRYNDEKFLMNGLEEKCSVSDIKTLQIISLGKYIAKSINKYIGYLVSIYADYTDYNYDEHLNLLENREPQLFKIVTDFWNKWIAFDIENINTNHSFDIELADSFITDIETWVEHKMLK